MKYLKLLGALIIIMASCEKNTSGDYDDSNISTIQVTVDGNYIGNKISTVADEVTINDNLKGVRSFINDKVQTFVVNDGEKVFLMGRYPITGKIQMVLDAKSTTLALVTMYPLFSPVASDNYDELVSLITTNKYYNPLYNEVSKIIAEKKNIYDVENEDLLKAFNNLIEDLCKDTDETIYGDTLAVIENKDISTTRAEYKTARLDPTYIIADITGKRLTLRTVGLTPTYYGTVTHVGGTENLALKSRSDFGGMDLFTKTVGNWKYGDPMHYTFNKEGEHHFNFSRLTPEASVDFYMRLANCLLTSLGLDLGESIYLEIGNSISNAMINAGSGVNDNIIDPMAWIGIAYDATLNYIKSGKFLGRKILPSFVTGANFLSACMTFYNKLKGTGNLAMRVAYAIKAPETLSFCLCNYDEVSTCSSAKIVIASGDEQTGFSEQKLLDPLCVYVRSFDENGMYIESSNYHKVKYEVTKGGGKVSPDLVTADSEHLASVEWTLGKSGEQEVRAVVIDVITEKEISEPVFFKADLEEADITIRLTWEQHIGDTDIDLHVIDPNGEEIWFENMESASGGFLDRDDIVGPGPEHVYWKNAPAGTYKIYIHYYPNEGADRSIVGYTVEVNAKGKEYLPATGSIKYDEKIPIGQFTIGDLTNPVSNSTSLKSIKHPYKFSVPRKKKIIYN